MTFFKKEEPYEPIGSLIGDGDDYHIYQMTVQDRIIAGVIGMGIGGIVAYLFFHNIVVTVAAAVVVAVLAQGMYRRSRIKKRKKNLLLQFKDLLEALTSSFSTGKNALDSFKDAWKDLEQVYGDQADITQELEIIVAGMEHNIIIEELLGNFAMRSGLEDVASFADVFRVSLRQGANIKDIIASTRDVISDKIEIEMEIQTIIAGSQNELNLMMVMPLIILVSLGGMGSDMTAASNTFVNVVIKLAALGMFYLAYYLGRKFTDIKI
ncbi:MAG: kinase [Eubacterium sp.]|nr:kinase [Eubacterium sp.]